MEVGEFEPRVKTLSYKVRASSRESPAQKATNVLDSDLRTHWSTATNTKEWILLELDEPALLFYVRIYNKSVLEWEISAGLRYKPEAFVKVRPRSEAPRRDMTYPVNYTPCRYVRISCMRGNPIAIFFIQLIGIPVASLEPEFQPVVDYLLPRIISKKQDTDTGDMHLQLLQDVTSRLARFLPHLEVDLNGFSETAEGSMRFLAMLAGPFYPILQLANERETARLALNGSDHEASKPNPSSTALTVSSNFEPRRTRNAPSVLSPILSHVVFRPDAVFALLRKAYSHPELGDVCRTVSRVLFKLMEPITLNEPSKPASDIEEGAPRPAVSGLVSLTDYSDLYGEEFQIPNDVSDPSCLNLLDIAIVEEGLMHVLYGYASQPLQCSKLADDTWLTLPLIQALLPALRPTVSSPYQIDDNFSLWRQPLVQKAMSQIFATSSSMTYRLLLRACAGYLTSFSPSHAKAACVLIDLCSGVLAPWIAQVIAKVDLAVELLEDLIGVIQGPRVSLPGARAALKYIILALSGNMDDIMAKYKDAKYRILFLVEMLEPFLGPAVHPLKGIVFGNESSTCDKNQENNCALAVNVIHMAVTKAAALPTLESEWRRGSVSPSVLLSVLDTQMQLPPDIDRCKFSSVENVRPQSRLNDPEGADVKIDDTDANGKVAVVEDASLLFAPAELNTLSLIQVPAHTDGKFSNLESENVNKKESNNQFPLDLDVGHGIEFYNLLADHSQLMNYRDCELKASEFKRLAMDLNSQSEITLEGQEVAIDALLLAAECYIVPHFKGVSPDAKKLFATRSNENRKLADINKIFSEKDKKLKLVADIERKRDRVVIELLIEAAELDNKYRKLELDDEITDSFVINLSEEDNLSADAVSLVRQNQSLLSNFLIQRLKRGEKNSTHEILIWCLLFLLHSATKLHCSAEHVVDIILNVAESLNTQVNAINYQLKEGNTVDLSSYKLHELQRRWTLLQSLVVASSGSDEQSELSINVRNGFRFSNLVPNSVWILKVSVFSSSPFPLVRYFGWMAVARNAKQFLNERLFLVSDLSQLSYLLSIFSDDLSRIDNIFERKNIEGSSVQNDMLRVLHLDMSNFFPNLKKEFESFGESILVAVGLQLKFLSLTVVPDLISWFSNLCSWPFVEKAHIKGFVAKNAKAVILYILEAIVVEHMEAMVHEIPRLVQVLVSLCGTSYCDVAFLDSVLCLLKPIITYSLGKVSDEEKLLVDEPCDNFESLCFRELFNNIGSRHENQNIRGKCPALTIFVVATIFGDLAIQSKSELLKSAILCAEFTSFEETIVFHDYLCAYQVLIENCKNLLVDNLRVWGIIPLKMFHSESSICTFDDFSKSSSLFLNEMYQRQPSSNEVVEKHQDGYSAVSKLTLEEIKTISQLLDALILKLNPTVEKCWKIHHKLAKILALTSAECFIYSRYLCFSAQKMHSSGKLVQNELMDECAEVWKTSLAGFTNVILTLQENHCWEVAFVFLDSILGLPNSFHLDNVTGDICSAVKNFSNCAPNISWRLKTDNLISSLLSRRIIDSAQTETPLIDLFSALLGHAEPEQRYIALKQLGRLIGQEMDGTTFLPLTSEITSNERILSPVVSSTWDRVALMASSDTSMLLRTHAMILLISYIPLADRNILQSFLTAADSVLQCLMNLALPTCYGPLTQFSLALIASVCLYSPTEDIALIPASIWNNIESIATSKKGMYCTSFEKQACVGLWKLKNDDDNAKQILKEVLSSSSPKEEIPDFVSTRDSILQVIGNLTSARSYFDFFGKKVDQTTMELEETEMEMELLKGEHEPADLALEYQDWHPLPFASTYTKDENRLQQIKDEIRSIEKLNLRKEIVARRQQKLQMRRARQQFLENAALREAKLLQKIDRERSSEAEKELERQQMLELERAKTKELRHSLDMEKEKQAQRELQRELELVESGTRPSRREVSSSSQSRTRDRHRERENDRETNEGNLRTNTRNTHRDSAPTTSSTSNAPTVMLSGSRSLSGPLPTMLQSRERSDDTGSVEDNFDGSRDSGDTGSVGDPDMVAALEGQVGYGSGQRSRGGKSRQMAREREGRREGKWERKH